MRKFIILVSLWSSTTLFAECRSSGFNVCPYTDSLSTNGLIFIDGYMDSQEIIRNLNTKYPIYLVSKDSKIKLNVVQTYEGQMRLTFAVLKPETELMPKTVYRLKIDKIKKTEWNKDDLTWWGENGMNEIKWTTTSKRDTIPTKAEETITFLRRNYTQLGCGPQRDLSFSINVNDTNLCFIEINVKELTTGKELKYLKQIDYYDKEKHKRLLTIGHSMCSGELTFENDSEYEISFIKLIDASGNEFPLDIPKILTRPPTKEDEKRK
jgi:hypothetical protein